MPCLLCHMFHFNRSMWCLQTAFPVTLVSHAIILLTVRFYLVYTKTFHYLPRTRLLYQNRGLSTDCWKSHNPMVGSLGELPIYYAKMLDLIYGMIYLAFTRLFKTLFVTRQDLKAKEFKQVDFHTRKCIIKVQNNQTLWNLHFY